jgi:hypothetical protein
MICMQFLASARAVQWKGAGWFLRVVFSCALLFRSLSYLMVSLSTRFLTPAKPRSHCAATWHSALQETGWLGDGEGSQGHRERPIGLRERQGCPSPAGDARNDFPRALGMSLIVLLGCICTWTALRDCHTNVLANNVSRYPVMCRVSYTTLYLTLLSERSNNPSASSGSRDRHPCKFWRGQLTKRLDFAWCNSYFVVGREELVDIIRIVL